jgi:hypothetical protein
MRARLREFIEPGFATRTRRCDLSLRSGFLSGDGKTLSLRNVSDKIIPKEAKDSATVIALLKKNARNPELFGEEIEFSKEK